ncbi:hypothetical protein M271_19490 [Streptomyces rapamycinicus NRRL 5491]|nr:hypothetical protein M271_19490 [Streptomyces rapamycinicus NRRL 5491]
METAETTGRGRGWARPVPTVITTMITAVVGILGTLFAPLLQRRMTARQRSEDALESRGRGHDLGGNRRSGRAAAG